MKYRFITILRILKELLQLVITFSLQFVRFSFSQTGEDSIVWEIFSTKKKSTIFFVDIGAFHPWYLNNTAMFYMKGSRGINIEPNYIQYKKIASYRPFDTNLNIGISDKKGSLDYYMFSNPVFNTFSYEQCKENQAKDFRLIETRSVRVEPINEVLEKHAKGQIDFMTIDAEGIDFIIVKNLDFSRFSPNVISVETSLHNNLSIQGNSNELTSFIIQKGYFLYAHTPYNAILVNTAFWES